MGDTTVSIQIPPTSEWRTPPEDPHASSRNSKVLSLFQGNRSFRAHQAVAASYQSLRRPVVRMHSLLPVAAWFHLRGRVAGLGTPVNGTTYQIDTEGLILNVRLPELCWLRALMTLKMLARMGVTLPGQRGRLKVTAVVAWVEAFRPRDPLRLGMAFTEISESDKARIRCLVAEERQRLDVP